MAEAELIEQLRAQVMSLKSPRSQARTDAGSSSHSGESGRGHLRSQNALNPVKARANSRLATTPSANIDVEAPIVINVGGINYTTSIATLKSVEESYFALMLSGLWEPARTVDGHIFVDRNGKLFDHILEYLRGQSQKEFDECILPNDVNTLKALRREADFYQLPGLVSRITKVLQMADEKEQYERDTETESSVIYRDDGVGVEYDVVYSSVSSHYPQFAEEKVQELTSRANYQLTHKFADGFKVKEVNSGMVLDHTKQPGYSMWLQLVVCRERKPGQPPMYPDKPRAPPMPSSSSSFITHQQTPHTPTYPYNGRQYNSPSQPDMNDHYADSDGQYVPAYPRLPPSDSFDSRRSRSPNPGPRYGRHPQVTTAQPDAYSSGPLGSPIDNTDDKGNNGGLFYDRGYPPAAHHYPPGIENSPRGPDTGYSPRDLYGNGAIKRVGSARGKQHGRDSPHTRTLQPNMTVLSLNSGMGGGSEEMMEVASGSGSVSHVTGRHDGWVNSQPGYARGAMQNGQGLGGRKASTDYVPQMTARSPVGQRGPSPHPEVE